MKKRLIIFLIFFTLAGCRSTNDESLNSNVNNANNNQPLHVKNTTMNEVNRTESKSVSKHLANLAASVPNVNGATAVAIGNYAVVGIDVDKDLDRSKVGTIKYTVAESLKKDPHGKRAIVVADPDLNARLKELSQDIQDGKPIQGILNELADIVGRVMPEVPGDLQEPHPKNGPENQKQELDQNKQNQLDQHQQKQSNHQKNK